MSARLPTSAGRLRPLACCSTWPKPSSSWGGRRRRSSCCAACSPQHTSAAPQVGGGAAAAYACSLPLPLAAGPARLVTLLAAACPPPARPGPTYLKAWAALKGASAAEVAVMEDCARYLRRSVRGGASPAAPARAARQGEARQGEKRMRRGSAGQRWPALLISLSPLHSPVPHRALPCASPAVDEAQLAGAKLAGWRALQERWGWLGGLSPADKSWLFFGLYAALDRAGCAAAPACCPPACLPPACCFLLAASCPLLLRAA